MFVQCLGSGDAFGSGGRMNTSFFIRHAGKGILLDCGSTTLVALKKVGRSSLDIDVLLISHLHGDHIGGIPFILTERQVKGHEKQGLTLIGPKGMENVVRSITLPLFPGIYENLRFPVRFMEFETGDVIDEPDFVLSTFSARHAPSTNPHSLRLTLGKRTIAYSGDTEWNENLIALCEQAELFLCEGYAYNEEENYHMSIKELIRQQSRLTAKRIVLTHLSQEALDSREDIPFDIAEDGMILIDSPGDERATTP